MKLYVVLLSAIIWAALVWTAPVEKTALFSDQNEIELAKRAKETIMYGNQQNAPRQVKKRDPVSDTSDDSDVDLQGQVLAMPARNPQDTDDSSSASLDAVAELQDESKTESKQIIPDEIPVPIPEDSTDVSDTEPIASQAVITGTEEEIDADVKEMLESTDKDVNNNVQEAEKVVVAPSPDDTEQMEDFYKYLMKYENLLEDAPNSQQQYPPNYYAYRRRRSVLRHLGESRYNSNKVVKRGKRIKRDLFDDDNEYYYPYESPVGYGELEYYPRPEPEVDEGDILAYLLSLYKDEAAEEPIYDLESPYQRVLEEEPVYVPVKRQMLSTLPGLRKRYFYPVNNEPQTHWGAFVPEQKREYYDAYDRVQRVARALAEEEAAEYYPSLYGGYKKK